MVHCLWMNGLNAMVLIDMLKEITSLANYFNNVKQEKRYQKVAVKAYRYNYGKIVSYKKAITWIDDWVRKNVAKRKDNKTCFVMSDFLNRFIREMNEKEELLAKNRAIRAGWVVPPVVDPQLVAVDPQPLL